MDDFAAPGSLFPAEWDLVADAIPKRRAEFARGRTCAHRAMEHLGLPHVPLPALPNRAPAWPAALVGSLTHCAGCTAAAVGRAQAWRVIGIDAERNLPLPRGVLSVIASASEQAMLRLLPNIGVHWERLLFSAKESVYKAWSPLTGAWLDFLQAEVVIDYQAATFRAIIRAEQAAALPSIEGRFTASAEHLLTAVAVPR